jgi:hypothetical protein
MIQNAEKVLELGITAIPIPAPVGKQDIGLVEIGS